MSSAYTAAQVDRYFDYISLPEEFKRGRPKHRLDLAFLTALHVHQICAIPYENLSLHYSSTREISLDPQVLYEKLTRTGRGGYCMENTIFFRHVLLSLGFKVYSTGARVRPRKDGIPQGDYLGWVHSVNIVTLTDGGRYASDVAFGGDGATKPLPLKEGIVTRNIGTQDLRLARDFIDGQLCTDDPSQKLWIYQFRNGQDQPWNSFYAFSELEFLPQDFDVMNYFTSKGPQFQIYKVLGVKFLKRENEPDVYGKVILLDGLVKRNDGGKTYVVKACETEPERIEALKDHFGIELTEEEKFAIRGRITELKQS